MLCLWKSSLLTKGGQVVVGELFLLFFPSHLSAFCKSINPEIWSGLVINVLKICTSLQSENTFLVKFLSWDSFPHYLDHSILWMLFVLLCPLKHRWAWKPGPFWVWMEQSTGKDGDLSGANDSAGFQRSGLSFLIDFNSGLSGWAAETLQSNKWLAGERKERAIWQINL